MLWLRERRIYKTKLSHMQSKKLKRGVVEGITATPRTEEIPTNAAKNKLIQLSNVSTSNYPRWWVKLLVNGSKVTALFDPGAARDSNRPYWPSNSYKNWRKDKRIYRPRC